MWYKCLNPTCGFVFTRTGECNKCPDCGKEYIREATEEEVKEARKPSLDELIRGAEIRKQPPTENRKPKPAQREIGDR